MNSEVRKLAGTSLDGSWEKKGQQRKTAAFSPIVGQSLWFLFASGHWQVSLSGSCQTGRAGSSTETWRDGVWGWGLGAEQGYKRSSRKSTTHGHSDNWPGKGWEETTPTNPQLCFTKELGALGQEPFLDRRKFQEGKIFPVCLSSDIGAMGKWKGEKCGKWFKDSISTLITLSYWAKVVPELGDKRNFELDIKVLKLYLTVCIWQMF